MRRAHPSHPNSGASTAPPLPITHSRCRTQSGPEFGGRLSFADQQARVFLSGFSESLMAIKRRWRATAKMCAFCFSFPVSGLQLQIRHANFNFNSIDLILSVPSAFQCINRIWLTKHIFGCHLIKKTCYCRVIRNLISPIILYLTADPGGPGICAFILTLFSFLLILATFPLSLCFSVKVRHSFTFHIIIILAYARYCCSAMEAISIIGLHVARSFGAISNLSSYRFSHSFPPNTVVMSSPVIFETLYCRLIFQSIYNASLAINGLMRRKLMWWIWIVK
jgi:hypothetical protein